MPGSRRSSVRCASSSRSASSCRRRWRISSSRDSSCLCSSSAGTYVEGRPPRLAPEAALVAELALAPVEGGGARADGWAEPAALKAARRPTPAAVLRAPWRAPLSPSTPLPSRSGAEVLRARVFEPTPVTAPATRRPTVAPTMAPTMAPRTAGGGASFWALTMAPPRLITGIAIPDGKRDVLRSRRPGRGAAAALVVPPRSPKMDSPSPQSPSSSPPTPPPIENAPRDICEPRRAALASCLANASAGGAGAGGIGSADIGTAGCRCVCRCVGGGGRGRGGGANVTCCCAVAVWAGAGACHCCSGACHCC